MTIAQIGTVIETFQLSKRVRRVRYSIVTSGDASGGLITIDWKPPTKARELWTLTGFRYTADLTGNVGVALELPGFNNKIVETWPETIGFICVYEGSPLASASTRGDALSQPIFLGQPYLSNDTSEVIRVSSNNPGVAKFVRVAIDFLVEEMMPFS